jgi:hypothetical protein
VAGRLRMNKFIGDLGAQGAQQIRVALKKADMFVIGGGDQGIDLYSEITPVLEEEFNGPQRQLTFKERAHEWAFGNPLLPALDNSLIYLIDVGFGFVRTHFDAKPRRDAGHDSFTLTLTLSRQGRGKTDAAPFPYVL